MAGNYSNIDLANKMECISKIEYLLSTSKITMHHLPREKFAPSRFEKNFFGGSFLSSKNQTQSQAILFLLPAAFPLIKIHRGEQAA